MAARRDPHLAELARGPGPLRIAACWPRAVQGLFVLADAPLPRITDLPRLDVLLVDHGEAPGGAGETVITAAGAAVANAVRAASGHRITRLPTAAVPVAAS
jgi:hypothetical protein